MDGYLELSRDDRRLLREDARATLGLTAESNPVRAQMN